MGVWTDGDFTHTAFIKHTGVSVETSMVKVADIRRALYEHIQASLKV
jgi:hypothetical protein